MNYFVFSIISIFGFVQGNDFRLLYPLDRIHKYTKRDNPSDPISGTYSIFARGLDVQREFKIEGIMDGKPNIVATFVWSHITIAFKANKVIEASIQEGPSNTYLLLYFSSDENVQSFYEDIQPKIDLKMASCFNVGVLKERIFSWSQDEPQLLSEDTLTVRASFYMKTDFFRNTCHFFVKGTSQSEVESTEQTYLFFKSKTFYVALRDGKIYLWFQNTISTAYILEFLQSNEAKIVYDRISIYAINVVIDAVDFHLKTE